MPVELKLDKKSRKNLERNFRVIKKEYPKRTWEMVVKMLFDMKFLAQQKLKADEHIVTSRLRNSIMVKTPTKGEGDDTKYSDNEGEIFDGDLKSVKLRDFEGAFGSNVIYAQAIEFLHDSYIYWAAKHVNVKKRVSELARELKEIKFIQ